MSLRELIPPNYLLLEHHQGRGPWLGTSAAPPVSKTHRSRSAAHSPESLLHSQPPASGRHALLTPCLDLAQPYSPACGQVSQEV